MTAKETEKLWALFAAVWSRAPQLNDRSVKMAWALALAPYAYGDVRESAVNYIRKNKFFPDICDITAGLPSLNLIDDWEPHERYMERLRRLAGDIRDEYHRRGERSPGEILAETARQRDEAEIAAKERKSHKAEAFNG